jgi:ankyrin repeat protein
VAAEAKNDLAARAILQSRNDQGFIDARNSTLGWTAMHFAAKHGNVSLARLLMVHGANPFARAPAALGTPRDVAQCAGQAAIDALLGEVESEALRTLAHASTLDVKALRTALRTSPLHAGVADADGLTILHHLCAQAQSALVQWLLDERRCRGMLDVNQCDARAWTPLHYAASAGDVALVTLLLAHGADGSLRTSSAANVLHFLGTRLASAAVAAQIPAAVAALRRAGIDVNARNVRALLCCVRASTETLLGCVGEGRDAAAHRVFARPRVYGGGAARRARVRRQRAHRRRRLADRARAVGSLQARSGAADAARRAFAAGCRAAATSCRRGGRSDSVARDTACCQRAVGEHADVCTSRYGCCCQCASCARTAARRAAARCIAHAATGNARACMIAW